MAPNRCLSAGAVEHQFAERLNESASFIFFCLNE